MPTDYSDPNWGLPAAGSREADYSDPNWGAPDPNAGGSSTDPLRHASSIGPTPWYAQGMFGGAGPSVTDVIDTLPAVGGAVGGLAGLAGGTLAGFGIGGVPGAVGMAGVGGSAGESARQLARRAIGAYSPRTPGEAGGEIGRQAAIQAVSELGGQGLGRMLPRGAAMFAGQVDAPVVAAMQRVNTAAMTGPLAGSAERAAQVVDMPAASLSNAKMVPILESISAKGVGGTETATRYTRAANSLTAMADHTVARASKLTDDSARGKAIADGLSSFRSNWIRQKGALYDAAALPEKGMKVQPTETLALLDEIIAAKASAGSVLKGGPSADAGFYTGLRNGLTKAVKQPDGTTIRVPRPVEARDLLNAHRELNQKIAASFSDPFSAANKGTLKKISATMDGEMKAAIEAADPALAARLRAANAAYQEGLGKINSTFGDSIHKLAKAGKYDKIATSIANSRVSVDDIPRIMEVAGPEGTEAMQAAVIADLVSKAKNPAGQLTPLKLGQVIKTFGEDRLSALLQPEQMAKLKDIATLSASLQKGQKIMEGSQTAYLLSNMNLLGLANHIGGIPFRKFIGTPAGQKWLTTGFKPFSADVGGRTGAALTHAGTLPFTAEDPTE